MNKLRPRPLNEGWGTSSCSVKRVVGFRPARAFYTRYHKSADGIVMWHCDVPDVSHKPNELSQDRYMNYSMEHLPIYNYSATVQIELD